MRFSSAFVALAAPFLLVSAAPAFKRADPTDVLVLKFAHVLEQLETQFYNDALKKFKAEDFLKAGFSTSEVPIEQFKSIVAHEQAHIDFLTDALKSVGEQPVTTCKFDFTSVLGDVATMAAVARVVENVGVGAYSGAASLLVDKNILSAAATILTIEARHQSILNVLNGGSAIPQAFDVTLSPPQVLALAGGFISGCDLGVPANPALSVTNTGAVQVGTKLTFASAGIDNARKANQNDLSCQMLVGGAANSISLPFDNCVVPAGIDGPVYLYITNSTQPIQSNLKNQCSSCIIAGPTLAFLDTQPQFLGQLARAGSPVKSDKTVKPGEETPPPAGKDGKPEEGKKDEGKPEAPKPGESKDPKAEAPKAGESNNGQPAPQDPKKAAPAEANAPIPVGANTQTGLSKFDGAVVVPGWTTIPKPAAA